MIMKNKKKWWFLFVAVAVFTFLGSFNFVKAEEVYDDKGVELNVHSRKSWTVKFNNTLDPATITGDNIVVLNENGGKVPVKLEIGSKGKTVVVTPSKSYDFEKKYKMILKDGVKSKSGKKLIKSAKLDFTIRNKDDEYKSYTVCIDAGHGGEDSGYVSPYGLKEKSINLSVALEVGKMLEEKGINVIYTRKDDNIPWSSDEDLNYRFNMANNNKADYFVSIHCNYSDNPIDSGIETYYRDWDSISQNLSKAVQDEVINNTQGRNRGIKPAPPEHEILLGTQAHAIMVNLGFMSNAEETNILADSNFQYNAALGISRGILNSLNLSDNTKEKPIISSIKNISENISTGSSYTLPTFVQATMSNGSVKKVGVIWDNKNVNTSVAGTYTYKGTVAGYNQQIILTLNVKGHSTNNNVVTIDPGHGMGRDTGAVGGVVEDEVALKVGLKVGAILEKHGVDVVYTRKTDQRSKNGMTVNESLQKRVDISNAAGARYFVSIHCNSFESSGASGTETLYNVGNEESRRLALAIQNNIVKEVGTYNRGLKDGNWLYLVNNSKATATVLAELGFVTNPSDVEKLKSDEYLDKYAKAISNGILKTMGKI
ncbi:N-acetylmuramoyl-L-alanine amidase [Clostridium tetani]|nr:N-acetylmuramoyl-L-alanine amidase [Clostridium tetani]